MIISKTPYRISFFGGGSDYSEWFNRENGEVISTTIDKYIYLSYRELPNFWKHKYRICWSKIEQVNKIDEIQHKVVREALKKFKLNQGLEIHYDGDLPAKSGMGSSSTFVVGLLNIIHTYKNFKITKRELALKSVNFEKKVLKENVGYQDQIAASYGGFNNIIFTKTNNFRVSNIKLNDKYLEQLNDNLFLVYTGISRFSDRITSTYVSNISKTKKTQIRNILDSVSKGKKILKNQQLDDFGYLLHETWMAKKELSNSISNKEIDNIYNTGLKSGAIGGKLLGAGGGGFILFYVPKNKSIRFKYLMKKYILIPFRFSKDGSTIIYNNENE